MEKKLIFLLLFLLAIIYSPSALAVDEGSLQKQVDILKSKIASKVAELNLVEKRGIYGVVTDTTDTQITLKGLNGKIKFADVDELTKFSSSNNSSFGISDVKKDMWLGILGLYNKESQRTQAREILEQDLLPNFIYGAVYAIDSTNFNITVAKENGAKNIVNIESVTKTYSYANKTLVKSGFSKITKGETVIVIGFFDKQNKNEIIAGRLLLFPEISASSKINLNLNEPTIIPSTGSGKKLTPIVK